MKIKSVEILTAMNGVTKRLTLYGEKRAIRGTKEEIIKNMEEQNIESINGYNVEKFLDYCLSQNKMYINFEKTCKEESKMNLTVDEIKEMSKAIEEFEEMGLICGTEKIGLSDKETEESFYGLSTGKFLYLI